jgi:hypothetical protein
MACSSLTTGVSQSLKDFSATTCRQSRQDQVTNLRSCRCGLADITEVLVRRFNFMPHLQYRGATRPRSHVYAARPHAQRMQHKRASIFLLNFFFSCLHIMMHQTWPSVRSVMRRDNVPAQHAQSSWCDNSTCKRVQFTGYGRPGLVSHSPGTAHLQ